MKEEVKNKSNKFLRTAALIALFLGALGSLGLTLYTGRHNNSIVLPILFAGWVLSPFVALLVVNAILRHSSIPTRVTLYILMLVITVGSLVAYSGVLTPPDAKPAGIFLVVPFISWILMAIVIPIASFLSRRGHR
jgi:hypothetical protein